MTLSNSSNLGTTVLAIAWVFVGLATLTVAARYYARLKLLKRFRIDDALILITLLLSFGNSIFLTISVHWGLGTHITALSAEQIKYSVKWVFLCEFFSILSPGIGRIAYAFLLLGLVPPILWRTRFLWAIIAIQFIVDVGTIIISFTQCRPLNKFWDSSVPGECWPATVQEDTGFFQGSVCSAVDLTLALFPASMFWNMNMELKKKIFLSFLMGLGVFAMIASIVKTVQLRAIAAEEDLTFAMAKLAIWWTLEANLVLIATSVPTLSPIARAARRTSDNDSRSTKRTYTGPGATIGHWLSSSLVRGDESQRSGSAEDLWPGAAGGGGYQLEQNEHATAVGHRPGIKKTTTIGIGYDDAVQPTNTGMPFPAVH